MGIVSLENRRACAGALFIADLLTGRVDAPVLLSKLNFNVGRMLRYSEFLYIPTHRTNYGTHEPFNEIIKMFNKFYFLYDFSFSRETFKIRLNEFIASNN